METLVRRRDVEEKQPIAGTYRGNVMSSVIGAGVPIMSPQSQFSGDIALYKLHLECKHYGHE
jgi:hypothetical protein